MTWTKLSDDFSDECWTLTDPEFRLLVEMLNYSNRKLLDCLIPKDELRLFAKHPEAVDGLVAKTYVHDEGDRYRVAFQSLYQPTRDQVLAYRASRSANGKKGGRPRKPKPADGSNVGSTDGSPISSGASAKHGENHSAKHGENHTGRDGTGTGLNDVNADFSNVNQRTGEVLDDDENFTFVTVDGIRRRVPVVA